MNKILPIGLLSIPALLLLPACATTKSKTVSVPQEEIITTTVLTQATQARLTPDMVIEILKDGNQEYINDQLTIRNNSERIQAATSGQYPMAVILSCLDSRVPVEDVFHCGIGDLFVARVAGNVVNTDILGSMEFACKVSGSKVVVVLGHDNCGAIRSAIQGVQLGNITELLAKIQPAVREAAENFDGKAAATNPEFVDEVCIDNVRLGIKQIRERSPILREMEEKGEIKIVGGVYSLETGKVDFFEYN